MGDRRGIYRVSTGKLRKRCHVEDLDIDGRIILKLNSSSGMGIHGLHWSGSG